MKKVGIVTMLGYSNYGNRLQNYAVQEIYKSLGCKVKTIGRFWKGSKWNYFPLKIATLSLDMLSRVLQVLHIHNPHYNAYPRFNRNIKFAYHSIRNGKTKNIEKRYDILSVGSDQVWNPNGALYEEDLLRFSPKEKNIAFCASIGLDNLDMCDKEYLKESFLNFSHISMREIRGKEIVEEISGRNDVEVFIDPTMILTKEDWNEIEHGGGYRNGSRTRDMYSSHFYPKSIRSGGMRL